MTMRGAVALTTAASWHQPHSTHTTLARHTGTTGGWVVVRARRR
eukprot:COSAG01_NODE_13725_length_1543_cov_849.770776_1_plen_43_part_10